MELRRSKVRPRVTYIVISAYVLLSCFSVIWLLINRETENALALFSGFTGVACAIVGFWFGARGKTDSNNIKNEVETSKKSNSINIENIETRLGQRKLSWKDFAVMFGLSAQELKDKIASPSTLTKKERLIFNMELGLQ
jgi:hypothetical protein